MKVKIHKRFYFKLAEDIQNELNGMGGTNQEKKSRLADSVLFNTLINGVVNYDVHGFCNIEFNREQLLELARACEIRAERFRFVSMIEAAAEFTRLSKRFTDAAANCALATHEAQHVALGKQYSKYRVTFKVPYNATSNYLELLYSQFVKWELNIPSEGECTLTLSVIRPEGEREGKEYRANPDNWINCYLVLEDLRERVWEVDMQLCPEDAARIIEVIGLAVISVDKLVI